MQAGGWAAHLCYLRLEAWHQQHRLAAYTNVAIPELHVEQFWAGGGAHKLRRQQHADLQGWPWSERGEEPVPSEME